MLLYFDLNSYLFWFFFKYVTLVTFKNQVLVTFVIILHIIKYIDYGRHDFL